MTIYCQKLLFYKHPHQEKSTLKNQSSTFIPKIHILGHLCFLFSSPYINNLLSFLFTNQSIVFTSKKKTILFQKPTTSYKISLGFLQSLNNTFRYQICCINNIYYSLTYLLVLKRRCLLKASRKFGFFSQTLDD